MRISELRQKKRNAEIRKEIRNRLLFKQRIRSMETGEKNMRQVIESMKQKAIEAERSGDHHSAIRFASEAARISKQLRVTSDMKDTIMGVHAVSDSTRSLAGIMKDVNEMAGSSGLLGAEDMAEMQISMEAARENMDYLMETSGEIFNSLTEESPKDDREDGENALKSIMKSAERVKRKNLLMETAKKLDEITRNRTEE